MVTLFEQVGYKNEANLSSGLICLTHALGKLLGFPRGPRPAPTLRVLFYSFRYFTLFVQFSFSFEGLLTVLLIWCNPHSSWRRVFYSFTEYSILCLRTCIDGVVILPNWHFREIYNICLWDSGSYKREFHSITLFDMCKINGMERQKFWLNNWLGRTEVYGRTQHLR